jgi:hypothetical protein
MGYIALSKTTSLSISTGVYDEGGAGFFNIGLTGLQSRPRPTTYLLPLGACTVVSSKIDSSDPMNITENPGSSYLNLDAGTALSITGPQGSRSLTRSSNYSGGLGGVIPGFFNDFGPEYLVPGAYTVDNGSGTASVGPFRASLTLPATLTWSNQSSITEVRRSQDLTVTWSGADSGNDYVMIQGLSSNTGIGGGALLTCVERASAGRFTIPAYVLSAMPASGTMSAGSSVPTAYLRVSNIPTMDAFRFQVQGLDVASVIYILSNIKLMPFL